MNFFKILFIISFFYLPVLGKEYYPQCDKIEGNIQWFSNLDCKKSPSHPEALQIIPGENSVVFRVGNEIPKIYSSWKNEFRDNIRPKLGSVYSYHLETKFIKEGLPKRDRSIVVAQWHDRKDGFDQMSISSQKRASRSRPPISIRVIDHEFYIILWNDKIFDEKGGVGNGKIIYQQPIDFDHWYSFDFIVKWSAAQDGYFQVKIDGQEAVNYEGPIGYKLDLVGSYFKFGLYTVHSFNQFGVMEIAHRNYDRQLISE